MPTKIATSEDCGVGDVKYSVIIPTLNEAENIDPLLTRVLAEVQRIGLKAEVLVVDGGSTDDTCSLVRQWSQAHPVRLIQSDARRGLSGDILRGAHEAHSEVVLVMDADLSHPPEAIESLVRPLIAGTHDVVIGSRYVPHGDTPGWPWIRRLASKSATWVAWPLVSVRDPMSGFFAVHRQQLLELGQDASGFKIGLEVLARGEDHLRTHEVPIIFRDRERGQSKLGLRQALAYFSQMFALAGGAVSTGHAARFAMVGAAGLIVDFVIFNALLLSGLGLVVAHLLSFAAATVFNYTFNARWVFAESARQNSEPSWQCYLRFLVVCLLALFLRGAVLSNLVLDQHWLPQVAILAAVASAAVVNFVGSAFFVFPRASARATPAIRWRVLAACAAAYMLVLRWVFSGIIDLMPQESYYWVYSQHLDYGYLDHPPMVAWLVWAGTWLLGKEEAAVRLPAFVCWIITAVFVFRSTTNVYGKTSAFRAVMLLSILPIYASVGLLMTPDAPLYAAWAGCLYFLERALLANRRNAWWGVGVCMGLGMLAKYTIALLGPATLAFILIDRRSRAWLMRPQPYMAALVALVLFSPVILWNANHGWASFNFQGTRRWSGAPDFSLHVLIGSVLLLLTPLGLMGIVNAMVTGWKLEKRSGQNVRTDSRQLFARTFTLVPLAVFAIQSLRNDSQMNWTGPLWLAAIPLLAASMVPQREQLNNWITWIGHQLWRPSIAALLLFYGTSLYYMHLGIPGMPPMRGMPLPVAWEAMANQVEDITNKIGGNAVVVGVDRYKISSAFAFYDPKNDGLAHTSGSHLFGHESVMWKYWEPEIKTQGKKVVLVSFKPEMLEDSDLTSHFAQTGEVIKQPIERSGHVVGHFYYRVGYDYQTTPRETIENRTAGISASSPF